MKKYWFSLFLVICLLLLMSGGNVKMEDDDDSIRSDGVYDDVHIWYVSMSSLLGENWLEAKEPTYDDAVIPNMKTAIEVASAIYYNLDIHEPERRIPSSVWYDETEEIWLVNFGLIPKNDGFIWLGDECSIVMQKKDGKVLKIYFSE